MKEVSDSNFDEKVISLFKGYQRLVELLLRAARKVWAKKKNKKMKRIKKNKSISLRRQVDQRKEVDKTQLIQPRYPTLLSTLT